MRTDHRLRRVVAAILLCLSSTLSFSQQSTKGRAARDATTALLQMNSNYQQSPASAKKALLPQFPTWAAKARRAFSSLTQPTPEDVFRWAVPGTLRAAMPPPVKTLIEQQVQAQGKVKILPADFGSPAKGLTGG